MLKKLVKYGNSNALIFDKAILELLEISEGSVLKIKTDGKSLIITPHTVAKEEKVSETVTYVDALRAGALERMIKDYTGVTSEQGQMLAQELKELSDKRMLALETLVKNNDYSKALQLLVQKHGNTNSPEFINALNELQGQFSPELARMNSQLLNFEKNHNLSPLHQTTPEAMQHMTDAFGKLFNKHALARAKLMQVNENPDYIHEMQLITDKYNKTGLSKEFIQEQFAIRYKYVPEARAMDEEMAAIVANNK